MNVHSLDGTLTVDNESVYSSDGESINDVVFLT